MNKKILFNKEKPQKQMNAWPMFYALFKYSKDNNSYNEQSSVK